MGKPKKLSYDYIVVGAGSAGCAAAYRLALNSEASVLLIESGNGAGGFQYRMPIGFALLMAEGKGNWNYRTQPEPGLAGRQLEMPRGRVMGGCSSINGMVYIRGQREDFDNWAALGNTGWGYDDVLPLFKRSEDYYGGADSFHGANGPLYVGEVNSPMPIADAFIEAAIASGIPSNTDFNGARQEGVGYYDATIKHGVRQHTGRAFLSSGQIPDGLEIVTGFDVHRVGFEGNRAAQVIGNRRGQGGAPLSIAAREEIILCGGAYNSPKMLELSGIGQAQRLQSLDIPVIADLPAVGENLQDHCNNYVFYDVPGATTYYDHVKPLRAPLTLMQYLLGKRGIFANPAAIVGAFFKLDGSGDRPDCQVHFAAAASRPNAKGNLVPVPGICASICRIQPRSVGYSHIVSNSFDTAPDIAVNFLADPDDCRFQVEAVRKLREIMATPPISNMLGEELPPLAGLEDSASLLQGIRENAESVHHPVGTCRMGVDDEAVVTPDLKVRGTQGLRVADASIMPRITSGNTHAACVMIGEKLADLVLS